MKRLMKFLTVLLVVQLLFGAAMVEAQPRAAHDNIVQQARCRTLMSGIERCGLRGGPQVVTAADKSFHVAYATWKVNGVEWLIARDVDDLRVYAYPPTPGNGVIVDSTTYGMAYGVTRSKLRQSQGVPGHGWPLPISDALWEYGYLDGGGKHREYGGKHLGVFRNTILPCESGGELDPHLAHNRGSGDHGRAQVNRYWWRVDFENAFGVDFDTWIYDPVLNGAQAARIENIQGLTAWVCYR